MRKIFKSLREEAHCAKRDFAILTHAKVSQFWQRESFFVYASFGSEAGTEELITALLRAGKRVCLPKISGGEMLAAPYTRERTVNGYGIEEPVSEGDEPCEVVFTPLLAADEEGYRLGYGGGYYDRYFLRNPSVLRVGLCYEAQLAKALPREEGDIPLHALITEAGVRYFKGQSDG